MRHSQIHLLACHACQLAMLTMVRCKAVFVIRACKHLITHTSHKTFRMYYTPLWADVNASPPTFQIILTNHTNCDPEFRTILEPCQPLLSHAVCSSSRSSCRYYSSWRRSFPLEQIGDISFIIRPYDRQPLTHPNTNPRTLTQFHARCEKTTKRLTF